MARKYRYHKPRHTFCYHLIRPAFKLVAGSNAKVTYGKLENPNRPYLIMFNHQTGHDQFYIYGLVPRTTYFVASEDLLAKGLLSRFLTFVCGIVPIRKNATDAHTVKMCYKIAQDGYSVALSPEGNRTFYGRTMHSNPAIAKFIKLLKLPLLFVHIDGGYGVEPRWSNKPRYGKIHVSVRKVVEPEEYKDMPIDQLYQLVKDNIYVDESADGRVYKDIPTSAEYLERVLYRCPKCGHVATMESHGRKFGCFHCGFETQYLPNKFFSDTSPFKTVADWWQWQNTMMSTVDINSNEMVASNIVRVDKVEFPNKKNIAKKCTLKLFANKLVAGDTTYHFDDIRTLSICGRNKLYIYLDDKTIQFKGDKRLSAVMYLNYFYHYKNVKEGKDDDFLGI